jgi:hypothetical protein
MQPLVKSVMTQVNQQHAMLIVQLQYVVMA